MSEQHRLATNAWARRMRADPAKRARELLRRREAANQRAREFAAQRIGYLDLYFRNDLHLKPCETCGGARISCGHYCVHCGGPFGIGNRGQILSTCGTSKCVKAAKVAARKQMIIREQSVDPATYKPNDPRSCRCGAKLVWLVDMWGQVSEHCDRCNHHADFGQHPIKDAA